MALNYFPHPRDFVRIREFRGGEDPFNPALTYVVPTGKILVVVAVGTSYPLGDSLIAMGDPGDNGSVLGPGVGAHAGDAVVNTVYGDSFGPAGPHERFFVGTDFRCGTSTIGFLPSFEASQYFRERICTISVIPPCVHYHAGDILEIANSGVLNPVVHDCDGVIFGYLAPE